MRKTIQESLLKIQIEFIANYQNPYYKWVNLETKITLLLQIAESQLAPEDHLLQEIRNTRNIIC